MVGEIGNEFQIVILDKGFELLIFVLQEFDFYNVEPDHYFKRGYEGY